jgi:hypothetical protein
MADWDVFVVLGIGYAVLAALILGWAAWRLRRPFKPLDRRPRPAHALPSVLMGALNLWWAITGEGVMVLLGIIGVILSVVIFVLLLRALESGRDAPS